LSRNRPDPVSATMALVDAYASGDQNMIEQARQGLAPVPTTAILESLYRLGQLLGKAGLTPEQTAAMEEELEVTADSPEMTAAVQNVGRAILIERSQSALVDAVNTYGAPLLNSSSDRLRLMTLMLAAISGSVCRKLEVRFNWKNEAGRPRRS
jgi:hypothetical protein